MSQRARSQIDGDNDAGPSASTSNFADRRQERMRGAGTHAVIPRNQINFDMTSTPSTIAGDNDRRRTSLSSTVVSNTPRSTVRARDSLPSTPLFFSNGRGGRGGGNVESSPAFSIQSGRGGVSSPSKNIDPRLLGDDSHQQLLERIDESRMHDYSSSPIINGRPLVGKTIEERRQERMRGAGIHQIESRPVRFSTGSGGGMDDSSSEVGGYNDRQSSQGGTPWKSPAGSLDRFMHAMANRGANQSGQNGEGSKSSWIEQRRAERRRGAGTHAIEQRKISFGTQGADGSVTASSVANSIDGDNDERGRADWIEQRRAERRRGAGTHAIEQRKISFDTQGADGSVTASSVANSINGDDDEGPRPDWIEQRRAERRRGAGTHAIEQRKISFGPRATDGSTTASSIAASNDFMRHSIGRDASASMEYEDGEQQGFDEYGQFDENGFEDGEGSQRHRQQSPGSIAAFRAMEKRKRKRQASPPRSKKTNAKNKKVSQRTLVDIAAINDEADETVMGQADITLQEQRETAFIAPTPPSWTFPKTPVTNADLAEMKEQVKEMVTLALGNQAGAMKSVKVNDADVLYSIVKKEIQRARQNQSSGVIKSFLDSVLDSVLETFTHLSRQSAERAQLIHYLVQARRRNLHLRKQVFQKRSQVLEVTRAMQLLKEQEIKRVQREEDEEKSLAFLKRLQRVAHEWC